MFIAGNIISKWVIFQQDMFDYPKVIGFSVMNCDSSQLTPRLINQQGFWLLTIHLRWAITIDIGFNEYIATTWVFKRTVASCGFSQVSMLDIAAFELHASRNIAQLQDPQPIVIRWPKTIIKYLHIEYNTRHVYIYIYYTMVTYDYFKYVIYIYTCLLVCVDL